jgi:hypothetical protein
VLAVADNKSMWSYFNNKLSSAIRNMRTRTKRKLNSPVQNSAKKKISIPVVVKVSMELLSEDDYKKKKADLKSASSKDSPDLQHISLLVAATFPNRRKWIDESSSVDLRLHKVLEIFPCFKTACCLIQELKLLHGNESVENFPGYISCSV